METSSSRTDFWMTAGEAATLLGDPIELELAFESNQIEHVETSSELRLVRRSDVERLAERRARRIADQRQLDFDW